MAEKRISLKERRAQETRGIASIFEAPSATTSLETPPQQSKPELAKVTLYIRPDQVIAIERIQLEERQKSGKKPDKSVLVQEALDLLARKYGID